jgi:hypothetical protein
MGKYTPPDVTVGTGSKPTHRIDTGYASNNRVGPLELAERPDRTDYRTTHSHQVHCEDSSVLELLKPKPIARAAMEKSGYWREPEANVLYDSPAKREVTARARYDNADGLPATTLKRMAHHNAIDAENRGAGPDWGSTTYNTSYREYEPNQSKFWRIDRSLIGKREPDGYTRQHVTVPQEPVDVQASIYTTSYQKPAVRTDITIPTRTVMEKSGFTYSSKPTQNKSLPLSNVTADDLPSLTLNRLKHKNTPDYQNLSDPEPYKSTQQVSYKPPPRTIERALKPGAPIARGGTGYDSNETVRAGPPGDPRWARTPETEYQDKYTDQTVPLRASFRRRTNVNKMERSGYWSQ